MSSDDLRDALVRAISAADVYRSYGKWVPPLADEANRIADVVLTVVRSYMQDSP